MKNILENKNPASLNELLKQKFNPRQKYFQPITTAQPNSSVTEGQDGCLNERIFSLLLPLGLMTLINDPHISDKVISKIIGLFS